MKKRIIYVATLTAMISATLMSGCNNTEVTQKNTETVITTSAVETSVVPTTQATETTVAPTAESETTVAQTEAETKPQDTEPQTEAQMVEIEKPETNKRSSNTNSGGNTTSSQKPAQNNNNNTSNNNKPSNNTSQTVTDDTKLTHEQFSTVANMQRIVTSLNSYYVGKGMTLNTSLTTDNSGWMFAYQGELNTTANRSYNEQYNRIVTGLDEQIDAFLEMSEAIYSDLTFNCYAEMQSDGEYHIYFCHE